MTTTQLLDPAGKVRATFDTPPGVEAILRSAWSLGPDDRFGVLGVDDDAWALAVYRPGAPVRPSFIGPAGTRDRGVLLELAWHSLLDDGWSLNRQTQPE